MLQHCDRIIFHLRRRTRFSIEISHQQNGCRKKTICFIIFHALHRYTFNLFFFLLHTAFLLHGFNFPRACLISWHFIQEKKNIKKNSNFYSFALEQVSQSQYFPRMLEEYTLNKNWISFMSPYSHFHHIKCIFIWEVKLHLFLSTVKI